MPEQYQVLTKAEVEALSRNGHQIDTSSNKLYFIVGLFDDKPNHSADPIDYTVHHSAVDSLAKSFIGRPFVWKGAKPLTEEEKKKNVGKHIRGQFDDPKQIIQYQKDFAIAEMVSYFINPISNKAYGIFEAYDEYKEDIEQKKIDPFTSTLVEPRKFEDGILYDGIGLHVQAVENPGYSKELAKIHGTCTGMLNECTMQLRSLGSSGQLRKIRNNFLNAGLTLGSSMSLTDKTNPENPASAGAPVKEMTNLELTTAVTQLQKDSGDMKSMVTEMHSKVMGTNPEHKPGTVGSEGATEVVQIPKKEFEEMNKTLSEVKQGFENSQKELQAEKEKAEIAERTRLATIIVEGEILLKEIPLADKDKRIKELVELKGNDGSFKDLSLVADKYAKLKSKTLGSEGIYPELTFGSEGDNSDIVFETLNEDMS